MSALAHARSPAAQWLLAGFLLTFSSAFGQTFFIAVFADELKAAFALGDGAFGAYYTVATLASSVMLIYAGRLADRERVSGVAVMILLGLVATSLAMAGSVAGWMLLPVFIGLRFFGQGMLGHVALTAMARWFDAGRGKAISVAAMGNPAGQAVFPIIAIALMQTVGWRMTWVLAAAFVALAMTPLIVLLLRREPGRVAPAPAAVATGGDAEPGGAKAARDGRRQWTRAEVLRDPLFYLLMPGILAPSFVVTGIFFNQIGLVRFKGWDMTWFAAWFAAHAAATIVATFLTGWAVDRFGSVRIMPLFLLPMVVGVAALGASENPLAVPAFMILAGISSGSSATLIGALWADLYGTRHLGSIRALATSGSVFASAIAPGLMGLLLDWRIAIDTQVIGMAAYTAASAALLVAALPRLRKGVAG
ncbi:MAG TPA: MFS transporter [Methylomirabilota bacterium]|nr:MFS transporter [Methylomirabilota bacterium]